MRSKRPLSHWRRPNKRLHEELLAALKIADAAHGMPYQRYIRQALERALASRN